MLFRADNFSGILYIVFWWYFAKLFYDILHKFPLMIFSIFVFSYILYKCLSWDFPWMVLMIFRFFCTNVINDILHRQYVIFCIYASNMFIDLMLCCIHLLSDICSGTLISFCIDFNVIIHKWFNVNLHGWFYWHLAFTTLTIFCIDEFNIFINGINYIPIDDFNKRLQG